VAQQSGRPEAIGNHVPQVDAKRALAVFRAVSAAVSGGLVHSVHAPGRGGLAVGLAKVAFGGELGITADLAKVPATSVCCLRDDQLLFSESNSRFVITVAPGQREAFEALVGAVPFACIGTVAEAPRLVIAGQDGSTVLDADVMELKAGWKATLDAI